MQQSAKKLKKGDEMHFNFTTEDNRNDVVARAVGTIAHYRRAIKRIERLKRDISLEFASKNYENMCELLGDLDDCFAAYSSTTTLHIATFSEQVDELVESLTDNCDEIEDEVFDMSVMTDFSSEETQQNFSAALDEMRSLMSAAILDYFDSQRKKS